MKIIIVVCLLLLPHLTFCQHGTIKGTILVDTKDGDVPDVGAKIYVLDGEKLGDEGSSAISLMGRLNLVIVKISYFEDGHEYPKETLEGLAQELKKMGINTNSFNNIRYKQMQDSGLRIVAKMKVYEHKETVSDGAGNYSFSVKAGNYFVLIKSKKVTFVRNLMDFDGSFSFDWVQVKADEETIKNAKFYLDDF